MPTKMLREYFDDYLAYRRAGGSCEKTIEEHKRMLAVIGESRIADVAVEDLRLIDKVYIMQAGRAHGEYGEQRAVVAFRCLLRYVRDSGVKLPFDFRDMTLPKAPEIPAESLEPEEIEMIRGALDVSSLPGLRMRTLMELCIDAGLRITEATELDKEDIDWERHEIHIKNAKSKAEEIVYFTDISGDWLKRYFSQRTDNLPHVFVSGRGRLLSVTSRNYLATHTKHLPIRKHIRHHIFRKTFTTILIRSTDIKTAQKLARHKSERTTLKHYAATTVERARDEHQKIMSVRT